MITAVSTGTVAESRVQELDAIVDQFDLNRHPFYQDWRMGTLPIEKLRDYAGEYGRFVGTIAKGWETLGQTHYAEEEREHEALWGDFKQSIASDELSKRETTDTLVTAAKNAFANPATALGALYAFEAQQPHTSQVKLEGLREHYQVDEKGQEYFRVHANDLAERDLLREKAAQMSEAEFAQTKIACALLGAAMWTALDGVYYN
jgi:pyrroloquinoline-quinone synthase